MKFEFTMVSQSSMLTMRTSPSWFSLKLMLSLSSHDPLHQRVWDCLGYSIWINYFNTYSKSTLNKGIFSYDNHFILHKMPIQYAKIHREIKLNLKSLCRYNWVKLLHIKLNCIWWWGSSSGALESVPSLCCHYFQLHSNPER